MSTIVKMKDRVESINHLRIALNMVGLGVSYEVADLISSTIRELDKKAGQMNLQDAVKVQSEWEAKWDDYHRERSEIVNVDVSE